MRKARRLSIAATAVVIAGTGLTACSQDRWCELDATDTKVANSFCEKGTPGYEWEPDADGHSSTKTKKKSSKKSSTKSKRK